MLKSILSLLGAILLILVLGLVALAALYLLGAMVIRSSSSLSEVNINRPTPSVACDSVSSDCLTSLMPTPLAAAVLSLDGGNYHRAQATLTPFQPLPPTLTPSQTPTPTFTSTATHTITPNPTASATATGTSTPEFTSTITFSPSLTSLPSLTAPVPLTPLPNVMSETPASYPTVIVALPERAQVTGFVGHAMRYTLDCEARSAVDLAAFFGVTIDEDEFLARLPVSDDPETGFVGSYKDPAGWIPPNSYGVYAGPIAALLRNYGLNAVARKNITLDELKQEIAANRPVMAWVVGKVQAGYPVTYTAPSTGTISTVAAYEHTVIVTGYDPDEIFIQDGAYYYSRSVDQFLASWATFNNMVVTVSDKN